MPLTVLLCRAMFLVSTVGSEGSAEANQAVTYSSPHSFLFCSLQPYAQLAI